MKIECQLFVLSQCSVAIEVKGAIAASKSFRVPGERPTHLILAVTVASRGSSCHLE